mmetsp:Transcript_59698/g.142039  ORF Transcript_59698/g.142039 Transcript_59698/m.142039 type:complete len:442 (+) Transcript_59698:68-1393(+)
MALNRTTSESAESADRSAQKRNRSINSPDGAGENGATELKRRRVDGFEEAMPLPAEWLRTSQVAVSVRVSDDSRNDNFAIHEGALRQLPYFKAYAERWTRGEALTLRLPPEVGIEDFERLLVYIYTGNMPQRPKDLKRAVAMYLLVDMMNAEQVLPIVLNGIAHSVKTAEHLEELRSYTETFGHDRLLAIVAEIESEWEENFLGHLVKAVIGDGNRVLGTPQVLKIKAAILQDKLQDRAEMGLQAMDTQVVLEVLRANAWIGIPYIDQSFKVSPQLHVVWQMIEPYIDNEALFEVAKGLASELDRPSGFTRVSYRGEQRYSLAFSGNRDIAVEVLKGVVRVGTKLVQNGVIPCNEVLGVLPQNYEVGQFEVILQPALEFLLRNVELLLPLLRRASLDFLVKLLQTAPRMAARKIARHVFREEAALKPNVDVFEAIRKHRLL